MGYSYQSEVTATTEVTRDPVTGAVTVPIHQDGYGLLSAGAIWKTGGAWTFSLQGSNLADEEYLTTGYVIPVHSACAPASTATRASTACRRATISERQSVRVSGGPRKRPGFSRGTVARCGQRLRYPDRWISPGRLHAQ